MEASIYDKTSRRHAIPWVVLCHSFLTLAVEHPITCQTRFSRSHSVMQIAKSGPVIQLAHVTRQIRLLSRNTDS
jgi:hypothetical protein